MAVSRLRLLDGFSLQHDDGYIDLPYGTQRLLALLALRGICQRSVVAGTLWPDVPESQALASLRTGVWRMNQIIPDLLLCDGSSLRMSGATSVDVREQEAFTTRLLRAHPNHPEHPDDLDWLDAGIATLWAGELLPGWYDDWVIFERERLTQLRLHALEATAGLLTHQHRLDTALQLALEAVRTEPLRETATHRLICVYLAEGNVSDAVHQYDLFRELLVRELGVEPSLELTELIPAGTAALTRR